MRNVGPSRRSVVAIVVLTACCLLAGIAPATGRAATTAVTNPAANVHRHDAVVDATVSSDVRVSARIEWGTTTAYGNVAVGAQMGGDILGTDLSTTLGGLSAGTTYHYRVVVDAPSGTVVGSDVSFTTVSNTAPGLTLLSFGPVKDSTGAIACACLSIEADVDLGGLDTSGEVDYGTSPALGSVTAGPQPVNTLPPSAYEDQWPPANAHWYPSISALSYNTTYYFQLVVTNADGATRSAVQTFTIPGSNTASPPPPTPPSTRPPPPPGQVPPATLPNRSQLDAVVAPARSVVVGDTTTLHYTITNDGAIEPIHYDLNLQISGPAALVAGTPSDGSCQTQNGLLCEFDHLKPGVPVTLDVVVRALAPGAIALSGDWVAMQYADPLWSFFSSNGGDAHLIAVARSSDVGVALPRITGSPARRVGIPFAVHVDLSDRGPDAAMSTAVAFKLNGLKLLAIKAPGASCATASAHCTLSSLAVGTGGLTLTVVASSGGTKTIAVTAVTATDPVPENNRAVLNVRISPKHR